MLDKSFSMLSENEQNAVFNEQLQPKGKPILFLDLETTGLSAATAAPIELAAVVCSGPCHGWTFHSKMRPFVGAIIDQRALDANGYNCREIMTWPDPSEVFQNFQDWINGVWKSDDAVLEGGYNYHFDRQFLIEFCVRYQAHAAWYGNTFATNFIEVRKELKEAFPQHNPYGRGQPGKLKEQYYLHFNEVLEKAHTAGADVAGTMRLFLHADKHKQEPKYTHLYD